MRVASPERPAAYPREHPPALVWFRWFLGKWTAVRRSLLPHSGPLGDLANGPAAYVFVVVFSLGFCEFFVVFWEGGARFW